MLKISFEKPKIAEEVERLLKKGDGRRRKKEDKKPWSHKERLLVGAILLLTILGSLYFWYRGQGKLPSLTKPKLDFGETIILEK